MSLPFKNWTPDEVRQRKPSVQIVVGTTTHLCKPEECPGKPTLAEVYVPGTNDTYIVSWVRLAKSLNTSVAITAT